MLLETERLILRRFRESDFADFCDYAIDAEMCRMMGREDIHDQESARPTFDWLKNHEERGYVIVYKENNKVIGNLTITLPPPFVRCRKALEGYDGRALSFSISRHYQRRGLMFEAVRAVIEHLFRLEGVDYINCGYFSFNVPSRELQKKLGFSYLDTERFTQDGVEIEAVENILWREGQPVMKAGTYCPPDGCVYTSF